MLNSVRALIRNIGALGSGTWVHSSVHIGHWTDIGHDVQIEEKVVLGDWSRIGNNCRIGPGTVLGDWASIGDGVTLGANVRLGSHTRVMDGVDIADNAIFDDCDLVTPEGVIPNRTGGYVVTHGEDAITVSSPFGNFSFPANGSGGADPIDKMIDDYQWGKSFTLNSFKVDPDAEPEEEPDTAPGMSM